MNLYRCEVVVAGWDTDSYEDIEFIWAKDVTEARMQYCKMKNFRKNRKGLRINEIQHAYAKRIAKSCNELVTHRQIKYLGGYEYQTIDRITKYYCGTCNKQITPHAHWCTCCNSEIIN